MLSIINDGVFIYPADSHRGNAIRWARGYARTGHVRPLAVSSAVLSRCAAVSAALSRSPVHPCMRNVAVYSGCTVAGGVVRIMSRGSNKIRKFVLNIAATMAGIAITLLMLEMVVRYLPES